MKKFLLLFLMTFTIILMTPSFSFAQSSNITVKVDGEVINFDVNPFIENNKTYVPVRGIFEKLGAKVVWKNDSKEIITYKGRTVIILKLNNMWTIINEKMVEANATPKIVNAKAFVPLRFISENFGATVTWDQQTQTINIVQNPVDDSNQSLLPLYYLKDRITTKDSLPNPPNGSKQMFPDAAYLYYPKGTPDSSKLYELESQLNQIKQEIIATKECIKNDKSHIKNGMDAETLLEIDQATLKELESKIEPLEKELKIYEDIVYKMVSTL